MRDAVQRVRVPARATCPRRLPSQQALMVILVGSSSGQDDNATVKQRLRSCLHHFTSNYMYTRFHQSRVDNAQTTQPLEAAWQSPAAGRRLKLKHVYMNNARVTKHRNH